MHARRFDKVKDREQYNQWSQGRGLPPLTDDNQDFIPDTGFIVDGFACVFVYTTNSSLAYLDNFISNEHADKQLRHNAGLILVEVLKDFARVNNIAMYALISSHPAIERYAQAFGATEYDPKPHRYWYWNNIDYKRSVAPSVRSVANEMYKPNTNSCCACGNMSCGGSH